MNNRSEYPKLRFHKADGSHRRPDDTFVTAANIPAKLKARLTAFDAAKAQGGGRKPTDKLLLMESGKNRMFHRPGSLK